MKDLAEPVSIPVPEGVTPTKKPNGTYCIVVEGSFDDGILAGTKVSSVTDYKEKDPEMPKAKVKGKSKKERPARIKAILGDEDEGMGY